MPVQQTIMHLMDREVHRFPLLGQPDFRIYEINKRLQQWSQHVDNLWWDAFATEFFDDEATLTLTLYLDNSLKKYTIGRTLIPRFFQSLFEGGVVELYFMLRQSKEVYNHSSVVLDCEHASMVTHHIRPFFTKVLTEGRLLLEMGVDELMRIRVWHFSIHHHYELIPRSIISMQQQDASIAEHLAMNITRKGLTNHTLNFLRLCVILEPMQELMSRYKVYGLTPRDCLKTTLFQKWQKLISPPDSHRIPSKRKKKKTSNNPNPPSTTPQNHQDNTLPITPSNNNNNNSSNPNNDTHNGNTNNANNNNNNGNNYNNNNVSNINDFIGKTNNNNNNVHNDDNSSDVNNTNGSSNGVNSIGNGSSLNKGTNNVAKTNNNNNNNNNNSNCTNSNNNRNNLVNNGLVTGQAAMTEQHYHS